MKKLQFTSSANKFVKEVTKGYVVFVQNEYSPNMTFQTFRTPGKKKQTNKHRGFYVF